MFVRGVLSKTDTYVVKNLFARGNFSPFQNTPSQYNAFMPHLLILVEDIDKVFVLQLHMKLLLCRFQYQIDIPEDLFWFWGKETSCIELEKAV